MSCKRTRNSCEPAAPPEPPSLAMAYSTAILGATLFIALLSVYNADKWQSNAAGAFLEYIYLSTLIKMKSMYIKYVYLFIVLFIVYCCLIHVL